MATTELEEPEQPTGLAAMQAWLTGTVAEVTDTGPGRLSLRVWILFILIALVCVTAPIPFNGIGVVCVLALAMTITRRVR